MCRACKFLKLETDGLPCHILDILQKLWLHPKCTDCFLAKMMGEYEKFFGNFWLVSEMSDL